MEYIRGKYIYKGMDLGYSIVCLITRTVEILADMKHKSFEEMLGDFLSSKTYGAIQRTNSLMWAENAEFVADEYLREIGEL
jgi:hypothetical protein